MEPTDGPWMRPGVAEALKQETTKICLYNNHTARSLNLRGVEPWEVHFHVPVDL